MAVTPYSAGGGQDVLPQEQAPQDTEHVQTSPAQFGGLVAQGLKEAGQGAVQASDFYTQVAADQAVNNADTAMLNLLHGTPGKTNPDGTPDTGYFGTRGQASMDGYNSMRSSMDSQTKAIRDTIPTEAGKLQFDMQVRRIQNYNLSRAAEHYDTQSQTWAADNNTAQAKTALNGIAAAPTDEANFGMRLGQTTETFVKTAQIRGDLPGGPFLFDKASGKFVGSIDPKTGDPVGFTPQQRTAWENAVQLGQQAAWSSRIQTIGATDPVTARQMALDHQHELGMEFRKVFDEVNSRAEESLGKGVGGHLWEQGKQGAATRTDVPGVEGRGLHNGVYQGALDTVAPRASTSPSSHYNYLVSIGATPNEALMLTGAAASESSFDARAVHDGGNGYGMYGHNLHRMDLQGMPWQQQAAAALDELRHRPEDAMVNAAKNAQEVADAQMHYERPAGYSDQNPRAGDNYLGRLNTLRNFSSLTGGKIIPGQAPSGGITVASGKTIPSEGASLQPAAFEPSTGATPQVESAPAPPQQQPTEGEPERPDPQAAMAHAMQQLEAMNLPPQQREAARREITQRAQEEEIAYGMSQKAREDEKRNALSQTYGFVNKGDFMGAFNFARSTPLLAHDEKGRFDLMASIAQDSGMPNPIKYGKGAAQVLDGILSGKITSARQVLEEKAKGNLTPQGVTDALKSLQDVEKPDENGLNRRQELFIGAAKAAFFKQDPANPDPNAIVNPQKSYAMFNKAVESMLDELAAYRADTPSGLGFRLWDSKAQTDLFDQIKQGYKAPAQQAQQADLSQVPEVSRFHLTAPDNVRPEVWSDALEHLPVDQNGQPPDPINWAMKLNLLANDPTDKTAKALQSSGPWGKFDIDYTNIWEKFRAAPVGEPYSTPPAPVATPQEQMDRGSWSHPGQEMFSPGAIGAPTQLPNAALGEPVGTVERNRGTWGEPRYSDEGAAARRRLFEQLNPKGHLKETPLGR